ncbi:DUF2336 domain-containing protein [Roseibium suaedae]|uniref:Uncharacterized conserved protein, DUF2336 family n=1 Tax=Roseibium suaedae TaxID=735517 RepID=A0A1M7H6Z9_9HYPH|nr:DUF2336 domain-containing protein [Roseibium suaedae]SHM24402.1 Uncharacterized conserved protein, DUF2336 family [Roseibium suaedae]
MTGRKTLVTALSDLFVSTDPEHAEQMSILVGDIIMQVMDELEEETRISLALKMCHHPAAPHDLMARLANDCFPVAEAVLRNSDVLDTTDLEGIARSCSMEHLEAIASRRKVEEAVTGILVDRGDEVVLTTVASNNGAQMANETFDRLVSMVKTYPRLQNALIRRSNLPQTAVRILAGLLTEEMAERVQSMGGDSELTRALAERAVDTVKERAAKLEASRKEAMAFIQKVVDGAVSLDEGIRHFIRNDGLAELGILLAKVSHLPMASVSQLIYGKSEKTLIVVCKATGVSDEGFKNILTVRARKVGLTGQEVAEAIKRYKNFSKEKAVEALDAIRAKTEPKEEVHEELPPEKEGVFRRSLPKKPKPVAV